MLSLRPSCLYIAACEMNGPTMVRLLVLLQEKLEAPGGRHGKNVVQAVARLLEADCQAAPQSRHLLSKPPCDKEEGSEPLMNGAQPSLADSHRPSERPKEPSSKPAQSHGSKGRRRRH